MLQSLPVYGIVQAMKNYEAPQDKVAPTDVTAPGHDTPQAIDVFTARESFYDSQHMFWVTGFSTKDGDQLPSPVFRDNSREESVRSVTAYAKAHPDQFIFLNLDPSEADAPQAGDLVIFNFDSGRSPAIVGYGDTVIAADTETGGVVSSPLDVIKPEIQSIIRPTAADLA